MENTDVCNLPHVFLGYTYGLEGMENILHINGSNETEVMAEVAMFTSDRD